MAALVSLNHELIVPDVHAALARQAYDGCAMSGTPTVPGERMPPLYFAGRDEELKKCDDDLRALCTSGESNGLQLTIGVPGSGKTRLADEFAKRVHGQVVEGRTVSTLMISPEELGDPLSLFKTMGRAIGAEQQVAEIAQVDDRVSNVSCGVLGTSVAVAKDVGRHTSAFAGLLRESTEKGLWKNKTLVLLIDELQSIEDDAMPTLRVLHQGLTRCPILLMGFGLQHTAARLASIPGGRGISRVAAPTVLHSLNRNDAVTAFKETLARLGHNEVPSESLDALADASHGFPQHINGYLEGAHGALARHLHLRREALEEALQHGARRRIAYYNQRLSAAHSRKPMIALVAAMERAQRTRLEYHDAQNVLIEAGFAPTELDAAIAHGSLTCDDEDNVSFGIPSFHTYMKHLLDRERAESG